MRCGSCQADSPSNAAFCGRCGALVGWHCGGCAHANAADARFCVKCGTARSAAGDFPPLPAGPRAAELRQITFLYVDLVGSTALSDALEPEAYSDAIIAFRDAAGRPIRGSGGTIGNFAGDGILAFFGYPRAAANDAPRAVQAALDVIAAIRACRFPIPDDLARTIDVRIGLHTGLTVIGSLEGGGVIETNAAIGRAANVAARVQAAAATGQVVITDATLELVHPHFRTRSLGGLTLKGLADPVELHEVVAPTHLSRGLRRPLQHTAAIRGRDLERMLLRDRWRQAKQSRGSAILISGEPGIGKSRLVRDFLDEVGGDGSAEVLVAECLEERSGSALLPLRELLRVSAGLALDDSPDAIEARLFEGPGLSDAHRATLRHFVLGTTSGVAMSAMKLREDLIAALIAWVGAHQRNRPLALLLEDLHWADDSTLMLLERIVASAEAMQLLVVATARDEFAPPAGYEYHLSKLRLLPLDQSQARDLLRDIASDLPSGVVETVVQRAGGNPLFLEELAHVWRERAANRGSTRRGTNDVPPSLRDALMERLDRLGRAKGLAQLAAMLGQTFPVTLLEACEGGSAEDIGRDLAQLVESSILRPRHGGDGQEYEFRHALVRDVAHDSVLPRARAAYHNRIVEVIERHFSEIVRIRPDVLAWHLEQAGRRSEAIDAWLVAGRQAAAHSANVEALGHLDQAISLLRGGGDALPMRTHRTLDVLLAMGGPLIARHGWAAEPVDSIYREAIEICQSLGDERKLFDVLRGRQNVALLRGDLESCRAISRQLLEMAGRGDDDVLFLEARRGLGVCAFLAGRFDEAIDELGQALHLFDPARHNSLASIYGVNPGVVALSWRAWAQCLIGDAGAAVADIERAWFLARKADHSFSEGYALCFAGSIHQSSGDLDAARRYSSMAIDLAEQRGYPYWRAWAGIVGGWARGMMGEPSPGLEQLRASLADYQASGARMIVGYAHALAADVALNGGDRQTAAQHVRWADDAMARTGMRYCQGLVDATRRVLEETP